MCLVWALALNVPFAVCHPVGPLLGGSLARSLAVNLVMFILPGVDKDRWPKPPPSIRRLVVLRSTYLVPGHCFYDVSPQAA